MLFGDGAGAVVLEGTESAGTSADRGILATDLHSDGRFKDLLYVDGGSSTGTTGHLRMQGREVFRHAVEKLAETAHTALEKAGLGAGDVDWIVPHQANLRIISATAQRMQVPMDRVILTVQDHGNTSAASIPLALSVGKARGRSRKATFWSPKRSAAGSPGARWSSAGRPVSTARSKPLILTRNPSYLILWRNLGWGM